MGPADLSFVAALRVLAVARPVAALPFGREPRSTPTSCGRSGCPGSCSAAWSAPCWRGAGPPSRGCSATRWPTPTCWVWPPGPGWGPPRSSWPAAALRAPAPGRLRRCGGRGHAHLRRGRDRGPARAPRSRSCSPGVAVAALLTAIQTFLQQQHAQDLQSVYAWILGQPDGGDVVRRGAHPPLRRAQRRRPLGPSTPPRRAAGGRGRSRQPRRALGSRPHHDRGGRHPGDRGGGGGERAHRLRRASSSPTPCA